MIADCREAGLPEPDFEQRGPHFVVTLWRDWLTEEVLAGFHLNERQLQTVSYVKKTGRISNSEYQKLSKVSRATATRDLDELFTKGILKKVGTTGKGTHYVLLKKRITKDS
jgi:ATP-dependent DNA helicase RecG